VNRQQAAQAKQPVMLTDAMLNELGKDHMGGYDNMAAVDDLYGMDAVWEQRPAAPEPLRFAKVSLLVTAVVLFIIGGKVN
jgi:hypothetical protein